MSFFQWLILAIASVLVHLLVVILRGDREEDYDDPPPVYEPSMQEWASLYPHLFHGTYGTGVQVNDRTASNIQPSYPTAPPPPYTVTNENCKTCRFVLQWCNKILT